MAGTWIFFLEVAQNFQHFIGHFESILPKTFIYLYTLKTKTRTNLGPVP
jgi:hypothetical protein